jgi:hypothetical protein
MSVLEMRETRKELKTRLMIRKCQHRTTKVSGPRKTAWQTVSVDTVGYLILTRH